MGFSLNGWQYPSPKLKTFTIQGCPNRRITLDADAGRILAAIAADYHATVRRLDIGVWDEGGYNDRDGRHTPGSKSNHANGTATDLNWSQEGAMASSWGKKFFANVKHKAAIAKIKWRYRKVITWGGDWRARDYMHWEIRKGVSRATVKALCKALGIDENGWRKSVPK